MNHWMLLKENWMSNCRINWGGVIMKFIDIKSVWFYIVKSLMNWYNLVLYVIPIRQKIK